MGLEPLAEHLANARDRLGMPSPARLPCPGCARELAVWLPEPGGEDAVRCPACGVVGIMRTRLGTARSSRGAPSRRAEESRA